MISNLHSYRQDLTRFNKFAIPATAQMAADREAVDLLRVHMYESKCIPYEIIIIAYSVLMHVNITRMNTIS